jgi:hypothetical protein
MLYAKVLSVSIKCVNLALLLSKDEWWVHLTAFQATEAFKITLSDSIAYINIIMSFVNKQIIHLRAELSIMYFVMIPLRFVS